MRFSFLFGARGEISFFMGLQYPKIVDATILPLTLVRPIVAPVIGFDAAINFGATTDVTNTVSFIVQSSVGVRSISLP